MQRLYDPVTSVVSFTLPGGDGSLSASIQNTPHPHRPQDGVTVVLYSTGGCKGVSLKRNAPGGGVEFYYIDVNGSCTWTTPHGSSADWTDAYRYICGP